jgi:hypothetical protein
VAATPTVAPNGALLKQEKEMIEAADGKPRTNFRGSRGGMPFDGPPT